MQQSFVPQLAREWSCSSSTPSFLHVVLEGDVGLQARDAAGVKTVIEILRRVALTRLRVSMSIGEALSS